MEIKDRSFIAFWDKPSPPTLRKGCLMKVLLMSAVFVCSVFLTGCDITFNGHKLYEDGEPTGADIVEVGSTIFN